MPRQFDEASFVKICRTMTAMANAGPQSAGYVILGIADSDADTGRISTFDGVTPHFYRGFRIVGIDREARIERADLNDYWHWIGQKLTSGMLERELAAQITAAGRIISYYGKAVGLFRVQAGSKPFFYE